MKKNAIITVALIFMLSLQLNAQITLNLKAFLEGPFNGSVMNTALNPQNLIPLSQPYNDSPWNYTGTEQVSSIPNGNVVDWVLVELRETTGDASTASQDKMINRQAAFIKADGSIVRTDGSSMITYNGAVTGNLYVVIWHRNHLAVMSSGVLTNTGGVYAWDFTDQLGKAYLDGQKSIGTNVFGMAGGDSDANGIVGQSDKDAHWTPDAGDQGYKPGDINLDAQVNNRDKDDVWKPNIGKTTKVPFIVPFVCGNDFIDSRDGQTYSSVLIGDQCWMAENLNIGTRIDGIEDQTDNAIFEKYCYDNNEANCDTYGGLYQWNEMMQYVITAGVKGICPTGWHLPTDGEWTALTDVLGGASVAGGKMKATGTIEEGTGLWYAPNNGATNESGFTVLPGGERYDDGNFYDKGYYPFFWSSEENNPDLAWSRYLLNSVATVYSMNHDKAYGFSVRCIKDAPPTWSCGDVLIDERDSQTYNTVEIGTQCWMAENLNIGTMINGSANQSQQTSEVIEKYCYDNNTSNCDTYGGLYQWNEMMQYEVFPGIQGICSTGWHLPTQNEYNTLINFLGTYTIVGGKMKETGFAHWNEPNIGATNSSRFTAFGSAGLPINGQFYTLGTCGLFWTSNSYDASNSFRLYLTYSSAECHNYYSNMASGFSVRCLKD